MTNLQIIKRIGKLAAIELISSMLPTFQQIGRCELYIIYEFKLPYRYTMYIDGILPLNTPKVIGT
jgi:hypothetical protein